MFFCYTNRLNTSNQRQQVNIEEFTCYFGALCWCNFDRRMIGLILMYFFEIIPMGGKSRHLQGVSFNMFLKDKKNYGHFSAPYRYLKIGVIWPSLFDKISMRCTFTNSNFVSHWIVLGDDTAFKNSYTKQYPVLI